VSAASQLVTLLKADSTVTSLIASGSPLDYRINPDWSEGDTLPVIMYQMVTAPYTNALDGRAARNNIMQISCWATTRSGAMALADAVEDALTAGVILERREDRDPDTHHFRTMLDWSFWD